MNIYTKVGDGGTTQLFGGKEVPKDDPRVEVVGTVDELNALLGVAASSSDNREVCDLIIKIQEDLMVVGADLATPDGGDAGIDRTSDEMISSLEVQIDRLTVETKPLTTFILPGGGQVSSHLHHARTVSRRAERVLAALTQSENVTPQITVYLNRLGDLIFTLARWVAQKDGVAEMPWLPRKK